MNANVKLVLMAVAAAVVANKVLAPPFAGLAPVQQKPAMAYGGTVLALGGGAALLWKHSPKAAALAAGSAAGLAAAGYQAGAYTTPAVAPPAGTKAMTGGGAKALPPGNSFPGQVNPGLGGMGDQPVDNSFPGQVNPGLGGIEQPVGQPQEPPDNGGGDLGGVIGGLGSGFGLGGLGGVLGGLAGGDDGSDQAGLAVRNQAGVSRGHRSLYG